ncbi:trehalose-6-phosphate phosphatase Tpp1 [Schizosaccharomyces japonicus yFS275]|uniref:Trehalose-6-phosphate phosphatase Tpp1 n=1 Tax=Schizosaccharomyces japonicus (strain yFS275 / FY16936) TaxID=402676 RepID=B6JZ38_SCHJY|nr:trehalose-6-phosphate phosphatase Tpp1 [Schizosaccharomyces japonicus yFS275]EEB06806.1 trehalose-6-phosphate phosphatase Tpp1 [Schizosaccharomyces japonicus yFS275]
MHSKTTDSFENENNVDLSGELIDPAELRSYGVNGRIIYALRHLPFKACVHENSRKWEFRGRRGATSIYSSMNWLANSTYWKTVLVAWTGVIPTIDDGEKTGSSNEQRFTDRPTTITPKDVDNFEQSYKNWVSDKKTEYHPIFLKRKSTSDDVVLSEEVSCQARWLAYAENVIRPLIHYKYWQDTDNDDEEEQWWNDYVKMNWRYAEKLSEIYEPGDFIFVQDYSLFLVPQFLKELRKDAMIGFFHHHPFPSSEIARCFPRRKAILRGVLGSTFIGFQDYSYARHFISCCARVLGLETGHDWVSLEGNRVSIRTISVGIDVPRVIRASSAPAVNERLAELDKQFGSLKLIVGRDRLDELYGVPQKFRAFQRFLRNYPDWRGKVVLVQITISSAFTHPELSARINRIANAINSEFGTEHYTPVIHYHEQLEPSHYYALLRRADAVFISSIREGLSTLALDYVVCQRDRFGVVLLSEFTATSSLLHDVPLINPWDYTECAEVINNSLNMPLEKRKMVHRESYKQVTTHTMQAWTSSMIRSLANRIASSKSVQHIPLLTDGTALPVFKRAKQRLIMLDYDGTLTPIVKDPNAAVPSPKLLDSLRKLAADKRNQVWIISGRDQQFLRKWMDDVKGLGLSAEHGSFLRRPHSTEWVNLAELLDMSWKEEVRRIFQYFTDRTQGSSIEEKRCSMTWHYRKADPENGAFQALECQALLEDLVVSKYDVEIMAGKANIEIRPSSINKGGIVKQIIEDYPVNARPGFVFCAGDDRTDEDMFRSLQKSDIDKKAMFAVTIGSSNKLSIAEWHLPEPQSVIDLLADLAATE